MIAVYALAVLLSFNAIYALIPIIVIIILISAAAGLSRGYDIFRIFGIGSLLGFSVGTQRGLRGTAYMGRAGHQRSKKPFGGYHARIPRGTLAKRVPGNVFGPGGDVAAVGKGIRKVYNRAALTQNRFNTRNRAAAAIMQARQANATQLAVGAGTAATAVRTATPLESRLQSKIGKKIAKSRRINKKIANLEEKMGDERERILFARGSIYLKKAVYDKEAKAIKYTYQKATLMRSVPVVGAVLSIIGPSSLAGEKKRLENKNARLATRIQVLNQRRIKAGVDREEWAAAMSAAKLALIPPPGVAPVVSTGLGLNRATVMRLGGYLFNAMEYATDKQRRSEMRQEGKSARQREVAFAGSFLEKKDDELKRMEDEHTARRKNIERLRNAERTKENQKELDDEIKKDAEAQKEYEAAAAAHERNMGHFSSIQRYFGKLEETHEQRAGIKRVTGAIKDYAQTVAYVNAVNHYYYFQNEHKQHFYPGFLRPKPIKYVPGIRSPPPSEA